MGEIALPRALDLRGNVALAQEPFGDPDSGVPIPALTGRRKEGPQHLKKQGPVRSPSALSFQLSLRMELQEKKQRPGARDIVPQASQLPSIISVPSLCLSFSCWDMNDNTALWWVIKGPVVGSIMVSVLGAGNRQWPGEKGTTGEEIKRSPPKPTSFFFMAVLYSATWTYTL